jgi:ABC-2 type transport system permease protein
MILMKKFLTIAAMGMKTTLSYVASVWASLFVSVLQVAVFYYIWVAVYSDKGVLHGVTLKQMITYVILSRIILMACSGGVNHYMSFLIRTGAISLEMLRPVDFQFLSYASRIGDLIMFFFTNGLPVIIISYFMFSLMVPGSFLMGALFIISILFAVTITFFIEFVVGTLSFYTANGWGLSVLKEAIINFFSGGIVPLAFFPGVLKTIVLALPFKDMLYTPLSIYLGFVKGEEIVHSLVIQLIWMVALFLFSRWFFKHSMKKITVQGG